MSAQQHSRYLAARFNEKGYLQVWGGDALTPLKRTIQNLGPPYPGSMC
jgi:hypothetical protein